MQDASVRVSVEPVQDGTSDRAPGALPVAYDVRVALDIPEADETLPPPVDQELEAARTRVRRVNGRISQAKRELSRMERLVIAPRPKGILGPEATTQPPPDSPTSARMSLLDFREDRERVLRQELAALERELIEAEREAKKLETRHHRATTARQASEHELRKALIISLHCDAASADERARLVVEYLVPGARWAPAYTIRLTPSNAAQFAMRALIAQQTGEDWRGVRLVLSTADAQTVSELPELASIRIGRRQAAPPKTGWRPLPSTAGELFRDYDHAFVQRERAPRATSERLAAQWEDETRELTMPTRRPATVPATRVAAYAEAVDFDEVTGQYSSAPVEAEEEPTLPPPPPAPAMFSARPAPAAPPPMAAAMPVAMPKRKRATSVPEPVTDALEESRSIDMRRPGAPGGAVMVGGLMQPLGDDGLAPVADRPVVAPTDLLAYGDLRMPPPYSEHRGSLRPANRAELYLELMMAQRIEVSFNVLAVISVATRRAEAVARATLPPRYRAAVSDRYDYAYTSETPVDVPSDGAFHSIALMSRRAEVETRYVVVPRESTDVFRLAEVKNPLDAPILDGPADVYLGRDFLLTSDVAFTPPGGTMRLGLGVEQAVKVSRNTSYREEVSGLMRGSLLLKHEIRIEVENHLDRAISCDVRERIPATRKGEDDIDVIVERVEPAWEPYEPALASSPEAGLKGGHQWKVEVAPRGGKARLQADYSIKIPAKYELVGGNRREA